MWDDTTAVPWRFAGAVVVRIDDGNAGRIFDSINVHLLAHVERDFNPILTGSERKAGNVADINLLADPFLILLIRLKQTVRRKYPLPRDIVETKASTKV